jgi:Na+:H+ antiporter, NhaA family
MAITPVSQGLPSEMADRLTKPFLHFFKIEAAAGGLLLLAALVALILANSAWSASFLRFWEIPIGLQFGQLDFTRSLHHWINDGLMTLFFFVVSLELKREFALGELQSPQAAALPFLAALGGMAVPVSIYLVLMNGQPGVHGWGTVMATDTAFVIGGLALFGSSIPAQLRIFLVSLAIFDDVGAITVVAIAYGEALDFGALGLAILGLGVVWISARIGIRSIPVYFILGGGIWLCFDASGLHATIAGVILGLMTPARAWVGDERMRSIIGKLTANPAGEHWSGDSSERSDLKEAGRALTESLSPLERLEMMLHPWVGFAVMPLFALANAGVAFSAVDLDEPVSGAIFAGLVVGKPIGVLLFAWLAVRLRVATLGAGLDWVFLTAGAFLTGIGFTMSIFISNLAYPSELLPAAKMGIFLGSAMSAVIGLLILYWRTSRRNQK